jgi:hypothetical protein
MTNAARLSPATVLVILLLGCSAPVSPSASGPVAAVGAGGPLRSISLELPPWIAEPAVLPAGLQGTNNCSFPFGNTSAQWDFHPDGACWEHPAPDGWTRNQQHRVHASSVPLCGGGPGDVSPIRMCRAGGPGQPGPSPACETPQTGPNGCVICIRSVVCH